MEFDVSCTNQEITPRSEMIFLKQMLTKIGFRQQINNCFDLSLPNSNRGYLGSTIIEDLITSIWRGATTQPIKK